MTKEYIKETYSRIEKKLGKQPSKRELYKNSNINDRSLLSAGFRSYNQLVEEMGGAPKQFFRKGLAVEDYLISYGNMIRQLNPKRIPSTTDWLYNKGKPEIGNFKKKFNVRTWNQIADKFNDYIKDKNGWDDIKELFTRIESDQLPRLKKENDECFVYLMVDSKNNYYKIGISNEPEWREKTLQSEKPSVKLVASKKFVNRRIAANLEKALHESYSHRRKGGEWFELDQEDIEELKITLST